jgi:hypothetical protein
LATLDALSIDTHRAHCASVRAEVLADHATTRTGANDGREREYVADPPTRHARCRWAARRSSNAMDPTMRMAWACAALTARLIPAISRGEDGIKRQQPGKSLLHVLRDAVARSSSRRS